MSKQMDNAAASKSIEEDKKIGGIESFMSGCKKGVHLALDNIMPAMVLGYVLIQFLQLSGIMNVFTVIFGPVMGFFGLPGAAIAVFIAAFFAKASGAGAAASMYLAGQINAAQATLLIVPCMLMGTLVGHYARNVLVSGVEKKRHLLLLIIPFVDTFFGLLLMRFLLIILGKW